MSTLCLRPVLPCHPQGSFISLTENMGLPLSGVLVVPVLPSSPQLGPDSPGCSRAGFSPTGDHGASWPLGEGDDAGLANSYMLPPSWVPARPGHLGGVGVHSQGPCLLELRLQSVVGEPSTGMIYEDKLRGKCPSPSWFKITVPALC